MASTNIQSFPGVVEIASNLTVDTNTLHVDSVAGRVGIGKTDPAFALDVNGTINATSFYLGGSELQTGPWTLDDPNIYYTGGQVGIGTNLPAKTLEVQGTLRVSNASAGGTSDLFFIASTPWSEYQKITASDRTSTSRFGDGVAISGDGNTAIVGAYGFNAFRGAVYIFTRSGGTWSEQQKITNPQPATYDYFGRSVAISSDGNTVIVGASEDDVSYADQGSAYIFTRSGVTWSQQQKLAASDGYSSDQFGYSVSLSGDGNTALVGAHQNDPGGVGNAGSAYIFTRSGSTWSQQQKITASDAASADYFGVSVAISSDGTTAIVGAYGNDDGGSSSGSAYIFTRSGSTWSEQQKITASDAAADDYFGMGVSISGDGNTAIVGAPFEDPGNVGGAGSAYIFTRSGSTWSEQTKLVASDGAQNDYFGYSVAISGDGNTALVSAHAEDPGGVTDAGSAYIFTRTDGNWDAGVKIPNPDAEVDDRFGFSVAISGDGNTAIVGAFLDDPGGVTGAGSAYIFSKPIYNALNVSTPITASGTLLSFTGQHMCFPDGPMSEGLVVSANKNKYLNLNGPLTTGLGAIKSSESLPVVTLSNVTNDRSVFGVVDRLESGGTVRNQTTGITIVNATKELGDNRVIVNAIGEGAMWVANTNGNLVSGDYITTSNIAGYGQKQDSEFLANYTVAKITMDCDFNPEDLPVQVIKKDAEGKNVLDTYGRLQWEDTDRTQKAYNIRYLTADGVRTDQANAVHIAAFVGCTYHCG